jgi:hypothetical protein
MWPGTEGAQIKLNQRSCGVDADLVRISVWNVCSSYAKHSCVSILYRASPDPEVCCSRGQRQMKRERTLQLTTVACHQEGHYWRSHTSLRSIFLSAALFMYWWLYSFLSLILISWEDLVWDIIASMGCCHWFILDLCFVLGRGCFVFALAFDSFLHFFLKHCTWSTQSWPRALSVSFDLEGDYWLRLASPPGWGKGSRGNPGCTSCV